MEQMFFFLGCPFVQNMVLVFLQLILLQNLLLFMFFSPNCCQKKATVDFLMSLHLLDCHRTDCHELVYLDYYQHLSIEFKCA